jgi:hypothetical protein
MIFFLLNQQARIKFIDISFKIEFNRFRYLFCLLEALYQELENFFMFMSSRCKQNAVNNLINFESSLFPYSLSLAFSFSLIWLIDWLIVAVII